MAEPYLPLPLIKPYVQFSRTRLSNHLLPETFAALLGLLNTAEWRVSGKDGAAEVLDINPKTLESRMQRLGIKRNKKNV